MNDMPVQIAIIGGSGLYSMPGLEETSLHEVKTPFGDASAPIIVGKLSGKRVAFLARHGIGHVISPSEINYRANIFALKKLGAERIVSISACGSLREDYTPGDIIIPDQLFDFTRGVRKATFFGDGLVVHIGSADPFCEDLSGQLADAATQTGAPVHKGGALLTIEGPRFSTKAESNIFRAWGMSIIGMTACPEAFLAREAEMCYASMAHVTDYDVWHTTEAPVTVEMVVRILQHNTQVAQDAIRILVGNLNPDRACHCPDALRDAIITAPERIPTKARQNLDLLLGKYLPR